MAKNLFLPILILIFSNSAHAVVADSFSCQLEVEDFATKKTWKQTLNLTAVRLPQATPQPGGPEGASSIRFTSASTQSNVEIKDEDGAIYVDTSLYYTHAFKTDSKGRAIAARQLSCFKLDGSWCPAPKPNPDGSTSNYCMSLSSSCMITSDPFGQSGPGWPVTGIAPDGTPLFNEGMLVPVEIWLVGPNNESHGKARVACTFKGTYQ